MPRSGPGGRPRSEERSEERSDDRPWHVLHKPLLAGGGGPAWLGRLSDRIVLCESADHLCVGPPPGAVILSNPRFSPALTAAVLRARALKIPVIGSFETVDFDISLWSLAPQAHDPLTLLDRSQRQMRDMARAIALCDGFLVSGAGMAARLDARAPGVPCAVLPLCAPAPPEAAQGVPVPPEGTLVYLAHDAPGTMALIPHDTGLAEALAATGIHLWVGYDVELPPRLGALPAVARAPGPTDAATAYAAGGYALRVGRVDAQGAAPWQAGALPQIETAALRAGALVLGMVPDALWPDSLPGPLHPWVSRFGPNWTETLQRAIAARPTLPRGPAPLPEADPAKAVDTLLARVTR